MLLFMSGVITVMAPYHIIINLPHYLQIQQDTIIKKYKLELTQILQKKQESMVAMYIVIHRNIILILNLTHFE